MSKTANNISMSLYRQWIILSKLPAAGKSWIGTHDLVCALQHNGIEVNIRTVQRDLNQLSQLFPIEKNHANPQGWRWRKDALIKNLPQMTLPQAITFKMAEEHLKHLLPPSFIKEMLPWFDLAEKSLLYTNQALPQWIDRVRIIPSTQPVITPAVNSDAQQAIYEGLLQNKQISCRYRRLGQTHSEKNYILNPLAIVQKGPIIYLVCTRDQQETIQTFALNRFIEAQVLEQAAQAPKDFNIDEYIESGELGFRVDYTQPTQNVQLKLTMNEANAYYFDECKLSKEQTIEQIDEDIFVVCANVPYTSQLIWWLRGFGKKIQKIEPIDVANAVYEKKAEN